MGPIVPSTYSWSPDDSEIVFSSAGSEYLQIFKIDADGSNGTQLTSSNSRKAFPTWSPDGNTIAFINVQNEGEQNIRNINTLDIDENDIQQIPTAVALSPVTFLRWSPDGDKLLFVGSGGAIYTINSDGNNEQQVTDDSAFDSSPAWSADGTEIVFSRDDGSIHNDGNIYKIDAEGSGSATQLTDTEGRDSRPFWSPVE